MQRKGTNIMKGKGYRSNSAKAVWIVIAHLAAVAAASMCSIFVMIYQTGIRLDDRGKSYTFSQRDSGNRSEFQRIRYSGKSVSKGDINYLTKMQVHRQ